MMFFVSDPPRLIPETNLLEVKHKVVVDDYDIQFLPHKDIVSFFPEIRPGFQRAEIIQGHDTPGQQTFFLLIDREIGV